MYMKVFPHGQGDGASPTNYLVRRDYPGRNESPPEILRGDVETTAGQGMGHAVSAAQGAGGNGSYDTHNSFSNSASVDGDGDTYYYGSGILGRMDFQNTGPGRFYTEASARIGRMHNEYGSSDLQFNNIDAEYDSSSLYYGLHLGTGYVWNLTEKAPSTCTANTSGHGRRAIP